ncbi:MAG TPA: permease prefix domain 1-containing protein, partial [Longimicrobiales bacterium]|nr:permease prefix domain 1-containing protein [Longimicrobiales bacterium]
MPRVPGISLVSALGARVRSLWRGIRHRSEVESEMEAEFLHHLELRTEHLMREGLSRREAARRARLEFGNVEAVKAEARAARGLRLLDRIGVSWLDVKLGVRMLLKYPGLSVVSVAGMAVAIAFGGGWFGFLSAVADTDLPLDEGDRIVALQNTDARNPGNPDRQILHDFLLWREELGSVEDLSAFTSDRRNLVIPGRGAHLVGVVQMTASGFR